VAVRHADNRFFEVAVFEAHGAQHCPIWGAGYARSDELGTPVKVCHLDALPRLLNNKKSFELCLSRTAAIYLLLQKRSTRSLMALFRAI
jgi:hypothetical protein